jgi:glycosyltransferase involved in cell wall biosynthesis
VLRYWRESEGVAVYRDQFVVVVMPAYNAEATLERTHREVLDQGVVDLVIVVDDCGRDRTHEIAARLPRTIALRHDRNRGYGGNQKTCYRLALEHGADIVVMVHPDYQYTPLLIPALVSLIGNGLYDCVLGSRILGGRALAGGMPWWKYLANRGLTWFENLLLGAKVSEYHTGYRAFSRRLLEALPLDDNSDDFVFDNQMLAQIHWLGCTIAEVTCPTKYFAEASSINLRRSIVYGLGCLHTAATYRLARQGWLRVPRFSGLPRRWSAADHTEHADGAVAVEPVLTAADSGP